MKAILLLSIIFMSFVSNAQMKKDCPIEFAEAAMCANINWEFGPYDGKNSHFILNFWQKGDAQKKVVEPSFDVNIYAWMIMANGHSHGGPKMTATKVANGIYEVKDARFFMGHMKGFWEVRVDLKENNSLVSRGKTKVDLNDCPMNFSYSGLCADVQWVDGPYDGKTSEFILTFWQKGDLKKNPVKPNYEVRVYSWMMMSHGHHHGGPKMTPVEITDGVFEVKDARFFMGNMQGYWEVKADLRENGVVVDEAGEKVDFDIY
jgi:uncharacterized protein YodC (DUF2158 family)